MDIGCNCFGVATAAKVPVKRYNLLVPAIFPVTEPSPDKPLSVGVEKNIHRLSEYLGRNEHRIPKASRRLARTIHADLKRKKLGYVKVGVEAFKVLIHACQSRFARLYAQELLVRYPKKSVRFAALHRDTNSKSNDVGTNSQHETSVVGVLLANNDVRAQKMGMELLLSILKIQDSAEYIASLDNFVPMLCRLAVEESRSVSAVALQCLLEHLRLCTRISYVAKNMDAVTSAVLEIIEHEGDAAIDTYEALKEATNETGELGEQAVKLALGRLSIGSRIGASPPCQAAVLIFREIGSLSHDAVQSRNIAEYWIKFMDRKPTRWSGGAALRVGLGILRDSCAIEHQKYVLTCALVRHLASPAVSRDPALFNALIAVVLSQAAQLGPTNAPATLLLAVRTLGSMLDPSKTAKSIKTVQDGPFTKIARDAVQALAVQTGARAQVASVIEAALLHPTPSSMLGTLFLCEAISAVYLDIPMSTATTTDDLNLTETMVLAVRALVSDSSTQSTTDHYIPTFVIQHALSILRHTLEATTPGCHTSTRAARALMSLMWSLIGAPHATPSILVAIQGLFRAFTETDISTNHGDTLAIVFAASLNRQLAIHAPSLATTASASQPWTTDAFCDANGIPPAHILAIATVTCGMWECLKMSSVGTRAPPDAFDGLKPIINPSTVPTTIPITLETNSIGLAVVKDAIDGSIPFIDQDSMTTADDVLGTNETNGSNTPYETRDDETRVNDGTRQPPLRVTQQDPDVALKTLGISKLAPTLGRLEFLHGPENHSPRKTSLTIVSAIQRVVSLPTAGMGVPTADKPRVEPAETTAPTRPRTDQGRHRVLYDSGMDVLNALKAGIV